MGKKKKIEFSAQVEVPKETKKVPEKAATKLIRMSAQIQSMQGQFDELQAITKDALEIDEGWLLKSDGNGGCYFEES